MSSGSEPQETPKRLPGQGLLSPQDGSNDHGNLSHRPKEQPQAPNDRLSARLLSSTSAPGGTPRSSGEFYSVSNHSSETLASEYVTHPLMRGNNGRQPQMRRSSGMALQQTRAPESLMMGYAQILGSFSLDGSLISLGPFEQVKKKAAVGGRGGGVIGLEPSKRETGLLRSFGWGNISNTIGDLWGGGELSTIKEIRGVANSKSVPLLSTPQSILFVDLQLAPGESRSFEYSFKLPKGLPPTHKGKAAKFSYSLVIGTQRVGGVKEQHVRSVEVPFRVLGSVNGHGEILGHDLMNPYVLLRDDAEVKSLGKGKKEVQQKAPGDLPTTGHEFLAYVDELVASRKDAAILLSPTEASDPKRSPALEEATSAKDAIHLAIMRSNLAVDGQQSPNRFEIARNGQRVGVVMLTRSAYRLGEVVTMAIDFTDADVPCYAVHATLETSEKVDVALAVRSESSIHRVTRKVYAASSEAALYSRRVIFSPTIPITATPEFVTSSISLDWKIRVEFVVPYQGSETSGSEEPQVPHPLLEQISQDEKGGLVLVAVESLACESFDVSVPLRVYGAVGSGLERLERDEASEQGLAV
ncbi:rgp1 domain-containing protein [Hirsutella rhossiliensis]